MNFAEDRDMGILYSCTRARQNFGTSMVQFQEIFCPVLAHARLSNSVQARLLSRKWLDLAWDQLSTRENVKHRPIICQWYLPWKYQIFSRYPSDLTWFQVETTPIAQHIFSTKRSWLPQIKEEEDLSRILSWGLPDLPNFLLSWEWAYLMDNYFFIFLQFVSNFCTCK